MIRNPKYPDYEFPLTEEKVAELRQTAASAMRFGGSLFDVLSTYDDTPNPFVDYIYEVLEEDKRIKEEIARQQSGAKPTDSETR